MIPRVPFKRLTEWCFWRFPLSAAHFSGFQEQFLPAHTSFSWGLSILVPLKAGGGDFDLLVPGCKRSRNVCSELKAGDAQHNPSPRQIRPRYFHALCRPAPCCKTFNCTIQFTGREIKSVPQWKTVGHSAIIPQMRKGLFWGGLMCFTKCWNLWHFHSQPTNAQIILGGKNPSI